jgi:DNA-binding transcriptional LysR family regulator
MSRALGRLRALLGDPLLTRGRTGLVPTPAALRLHPIVRSALAEVERMVAPRSFDPATWTAEIAIAASDQQTIQLLPDVMARVARDAPALRVNVVPAGPDTWSDLRDGRLHLAFGIAEQRLPPGLRFAPLYDDAFVSLLRLEHPAARDWTLRAFIELDHVLVTVLRDGRGVLDEVLAEQGLSRRVALRLPHFYAAMAVVARTDMVVTLPRSLADTYAAALGLIALEPPLERAPFTVGLIWPDSLGAEPGMIWIRALVAEEVRAGG